MLNLVKLNTICPASLVSLSKRDNGQSLSIYWSYQHRDLAFNNTEPTTQNRLS